MLAIRFSTCKKHACGRIAPHSLPQPRLRLLATKSGEKSGLNPNVEGKHLTTVKEIALRFRSCFKTRSTGEQSAVEIFGAEVYHRRKIREALLRVLEPSV